MSVTNNKSDGMFVTKKNILEFTVENGIAKGWTVILSEQCLDWHRKEHGSNRPEIFSDTFIHVDIREAIENPFVVYPSIRVRKNRSVKIDYTKRVFYKEIPDSRLLLNNQPIPNYVRVVTQILKLSNTLEIITALKSDKINERNRCKPFTKI